MLSRSTPQLLNAKRRAGVLAAGAGVAAIGVAAGTGAAATGAWTIGIGPGGGHGTECDTTARFTTGAIRGRGLSVVAFLPLASADSLVEKINKEIANMNFTGFITRNLQPFKEEIEFGLSNVPNLHFSCESLVNEVSVRVQNVPECCLQRDMPKRAGEQCTTNLVDLPVLD